MKVLIIEDETGLQQSIKKYLEHQGFVCEVVGDFLTGMEKVNNFQYDCMVVDIGLPNGSGLDIVKQLKKIESLIIHVIINPVAAHKRREIGLERTKEVRRSSIGPQVSQSSCAPFPESKKKHRNFHDCVRVANSSLTSA